MACSPTLAQSTPGGSAGSNQSGSGDEETQYPIVTQHESPDGTVCTLYVYGNRTIFVCVYPGGTTTTRTVYPQTGPYPDTQAEYIQTDYPDGTISFVEITNDWFPYTQIGGPEHALPLLIKRLVHTTTITVSPQGDVTTTNKVESSTEPYTGDDLYGDLIEEITDAFDDEP